VAVPLRRPPPQIADVRCSRLAFEPGDRVLVRTYRKLEPDERRRLRRAVQRWAGEDVEVLIYDATEMEVTIDKRR